MPQNLDTLRGLACILVVALHVVGVAPTEGLKLPDGSLWRDVMASLTPIRLPLFTALAGFLYAAMPVTRTGIGAFMGRKFQQLLIPLLFATLVFWSLRNLVEPRGDSLLWAYAVGYQHLWYLDALLLMFALFAILDTFVPARWVTIATALIIPIAQVTEPLFFDVPILHASNAVHYLQFFATGVLLYRLPALLKSRALLFAAMIAAVVLMVAHVQLPTRDGLLGQYVWLEWLCSAAIVLVLLRLFPSIGFLQWVGAYSYTIYLWHPAANGLVRAVLQRVGLQETWQLFTLGLAAGLLIPIVIHLIALRLPKAVSLPVIGR